MSRMHRDAAFEGDHGVTGVSRSPPSYATHRPSHESRLHRSLRISPPKTSASDSRLTAVDYFQSSGTNDEEPVGLRFTEMSSSAPHSNPLEMLDAEEASLGSDATLHDRDLQVQRTASLTSENPSEAFYSADEDMHASHRSGLLLGKGDHSATTIAAASAVGGAAIPSGKKRFASDLSIGQGQQGGEQEARLSTHRSDYEINTPEHRSLPKRPQSTTDMVSRSKGGIYSRMAKSGFGSKCKIHRQIRIRIGLFV